MDKAPYLMGIDEAGRGPVLGPLVAAGVVLSKDVCEKIKIIGVKDSKKLSVKKRIMFFDLIEHEAEWYFIDVRWPDEIDRYVQEGGLNELEGEMFGRIISSYNGVADVYVDSPLEPKKFLSKLKTLVGKDVNINCSFKADDIYPVVSCASVLAKVVRDGIIDELKCVHGDFGSGYPSDKKTIEYLSSSKELPFFARRSWKTLKQLELI